MHTLYASFTVLGAVLMVASEICSLGPGGGAIRSRAARDSSAALVLVSAAVSAWLFYLACGRQWFRSKLSYHDVLVPWLVVSLTAIAVMASYWHVLVVVDYFHPIGAHFNWLTDSYHRLMTWLSSLMILATFLNELRAQRLSILHTRKHDRCNSKSAEQRPT